MMSQRISGQSRFGMTSKSDTNANKFRRLLLAFAITPFLPGFYGALLFGQPWALPIGVATAYPSAIVFGVPLLIFLRSRQCIQWWAFVLAGMVCAVPALVVYAYLGDVPHLQPFDVVNALALLAWGAFSGACFWLLGIAGDSPLRLRDLFDVGPPAK
jgi:hypothetical protein